ncbi:hypothetical protein [Flavobacterium chungangense]|uniref:Uncharacterized protein n=1 Tax=Flavobacterium chungangense TaxID=554283 RepID=A0A6V6Z817_9FLAO|nr:hypothetical protein [Flavobacterium chungangense]CAD0007951.1 hypothetical protein FLACHUCJ7_03539 [Flavobacterium chungangense]
MKKNFLILLLLLGIQVFSQNDDPDQKFHHKVYGKCFKSLKQIPETENQLLLKALSFCSLLECTIGFEYSENKKDTQDAILKRAIEITNLLYDEGTPVYLISGLDSSDEAEKQNQNITDDNNLVYISVGGCVSTNELQKIKQIINQQTLKLINKK